MTHSETQVHQQDMPGILRAFEQVMDQNRILLEDMAQMARQESLRFAGRRLQHSTRALEQLQGTQGISATINSQHDWLQAMMQDYADQSLRYARLMGEMSANVFSAARVAALKPMAMAQEAAEAAEAMAEHADAVVERAGTAVSQGEDGAEQVAEHADAEQASDNDSVAAVHMH